jgi:hypothetical protein
LDHLYLRPEAPILLCDRRSDPERLAADTPLARAVTTLDATSIPRAQAILASLIADDAHRGDRLRMRSHYFGAGDPGESTRRFWDQIDRAISDHDTAVRNLNRTRVTGEV